METQDIIGQACVLTTIGRRVADKLTKAEEYAVVDAFADCRSSGDDEASADIGIGVIGIRYEDGTIKWRFSPSESLEKACVDAAIHKKNLLSDNLGKALSAKLAEIYKDLM